MGSIKVTDKNIPIDEAFYHKIELMVKRCTKKKPIKDVLLNIEGEEGIGKTSLSILVGYIAADLTDRPFSDKNVFADVGEATKFAQETSRQIIIFDEPASDTLSAEWWKDTQKNLIKLLMMARKKQHFFIFNLTKFFKFAEYIVVDRAIGMIHLYTKDESEQPHWVYIKKKNLERLYNDYRTKKQRNYRKYYSIRGTFPDVLDEKKEYNILDTFDYDAYEADKDKSIQKIGSKKSNPKELSELKKFKYQIGSLEFPIENKTEFAEKMGVPRTTISEWRRNKALLTSSIG